MSRGHLITLSFGNGELEWMVGFEFFGADSRRPELKPYNCTYIRARGYRERKSENEGPSF